MQKYILEYGYDEKYNAGSKARDDIRIILNREGYKTVLLNRPEKSLDKLFHLFKIKYDINEIENGSIVCIQWPLASKKYIKLIIKELKSKRCKVTALIHDITKLRGDKLFNNKDEINLLNKFDIVISHNTTMTKYLRDSGLTTKCIEIKIFDYICNENKNESFNNQTETIVFAGNLSEEKSGFLYKINTDIVNNLKFNLFGVGLNNNILSNVIQYKGRYNPCELPSKLEGNFGLVWDGNSIEKCSGVLGEYLRYNNPHKASLYIAAGIPIITWRESALGKFVKKYDIGILIDNLKDLKTLNVDTEYYKELKANILKIQSKVKAGLYTKAVFKECEELLFCSV